MKSDLEISLFGKFSARYRSEPLLEHAPLRAQELLAYLMLHRGRAHPREALAEVLWGTAESEHVRKYLRQALWQLHAGLLPLGQKRAARLLHVEPGWVEIVGDGATTVDIAAFERAFGEARGSKGESLPAEQARSLSQAVQLYRGDLLEGWSQEWCAPERDRLRQMHLTILDKLMDYCEARSEYEAGIAYGTLSLRSDPARERTHRSLMRLFARSGDRTAAIRQFERCCAALHEDLDVVPEDSTLSLYIHIRNGRLGAGDAARSAIAEGTNRTTSAPLPASTEPGSLRVVRKSANTRR
jgi:DNA-binding SARP family transcriptional activator